MPQKSLQINSKPIKKAQTITKNIMIKITRMIRFFLMQFMQVADGDLSAKFSGAFRISLAGKYLSQF